MGHEREDARRTGEPAVAGVLANVDPEALVAAADQQTEDRLVTLSTFAVHCRSAVERDNYTREVELIPDHEAPGRLALVLLRMLNALRAIGVSEPEAWRSIRKLALDSMPAIRRAVLGALLANTAELSTVQIAEGLDYPTTTTRRALEDLTAHGIAHRTKRGHGKAPDFWALSEWPENAGTLVFPKNRKAIVTKAGPPVLLPHPA